MTGDTAAASRPARGLPSPGRAAAGLLLVLAAVLSCFPKVMSSQWVLFSRDIHAYWYPMVSTFVRGVAEGALPLWDAYEAYGLPLWADPGQQVAYPPTWLNLLLLPHTVYKLLVLGHLFAGGAGVFALMRRFRLGVLPASAAAVTFACAGPFVSAGSLIHHLCGAAWMGWVLWAFEGVLERGSRRDVAVLALTLGGQALAGSAEVCAMTAIAALLRWMSLAVGRWGTAVKRAAPLAAAAAIGALLMAIQWLPTLAILGRTSADEFSCGIEVLLVDHPVTLVDAFVPRLISEVSMGEAVREALYDSARALPVELLPGRGHASAGVAGAALAATTALVGLAVVRLLPGAGAGTLLPAHEARPRPADPVAFRYPSKYLWAATLAWAVLAGLGVDVWWRAWCRRDRLFGRWPRVRCWRSRERWPSGPTGWWRIRNR